jgi:proteasome assembly chaperone (PAC2) family protein
MLPSQLSLLASPPLKRARLVMGLSGWMDGGDVSTATVDRLAHALGAHELAKIDPRDFYLYSFPGSMEVAAMFRPHVKIEEGRVLEYDPPSNVFHYSLENELILFNGREPNLRWEDFAECLFAVAERFEVQTIYFVGSVAGLVPHTREPRLYCSFSDDSLKPMMERLGVRWSNYEGPGSVVTYLTVEAARRKRVLASLVAEIPAYIQGPNPRCIESMVRTMAALLGLPVAMEHLRQLSDTFERKLNEALRKRTELSELITKLEEDYDNEVFDTQMGDLKTWLVQRGIRLD